MPLKNLSTRKVAVILGKCGRVTAVHQQDKTGQGVCVYVCVCVCVCCVCACVCVCVCLCACV